MNVQEVMTAAPKLTVKMNQPATPVSARKVTEEMAKSVMVSAIHIADVDVVSYSGVVASFVR